MTLTYSEAVLTAEDVPGEMSLTIYLCSCPFRCDGCPTPWRKEPGAETLSFEALGALVKANPDATCITFRGGDAAMLTLKALCDYARIRWPERRVCWYSGQDLASDTTTRRINETGIIESLDYAKFGPFDRSRGDIHTPDTNQVLYRIVHLPGGGVEFKNITRLLQP